MRLVLAADHAGVDLKAELVAWLEELGHEVEDLGPQSHDSVDYPDYAHRVAAQVAEASADRGILVCGTGIGMAISANRHAGVRAVCTTDVFSVGMARAHNDANVLCLGARVVGGGLAQALVEAFLTGDFEGGRHQRRVSKIEPG